MALCSALHRSFPFKVEIHQKLLPCLSSCGNQRVNESHTIGQWLIRRLARFLLKLWGGMEAFLHIYMWSGRHAQSSHQAFTLLVVLNETVYVLCEWVITDYVTLKCHTFGLLFFGQDSCQTFMEDYSGKVNVLTTYFAHSFWVDLLFGGYSERQLKDKHTEFSCS